MELFFRKKSLIAITTDLRSSFSVAELAKAEGDLKSVKLEIASLSAKKMEVWQWAQAANLSEMYRSLYALLCCFVHASANSLKDWLPVDAEDNLLEVVSGPTDFDLSKSLLAIATCLQFGIHNLIAFFGLENEAALLLLTQRREAAYGFEPNAEEVG